MQVLATARPETRVLMISGYSAASYDFDGLAHHRVHFLAKPFRNDELLQSVQALLGESRRRVN